MASDRATWGNYVHSHILGTQSVDTTPLCASTQALVPVWTAPSSSRLKLIEKQAYNTLTKRVRFFGFKTSTVCLLWSTNC